MAKVLRLPNLNPAGQPIDDPEGEGGDLQVVGIGNAIVDVIAQNGEDVLDKHDLAKGSMRLVDTAGAEALYADMGPGIESSGGSAANTMAGVASLGGRAAFVGRVRDDELGEVFAHDIRAAGVEYTTSPARSGPPTARCLIIVTPDAQRTMSTYLGAAAELDEDDVDEDLLRRAQVTYLEGYLWDPPAAKDAFRKAMTVAHDAGRQVAFTLSDAFCVSRFRTEFLHLLDGDVDVLFANEAELLSLYETDDFDAAVKRLQGTSCTVAAVTRSEKGSVIVTPTDTFAVPAHPVDHVVDTTGAGDLYAAGFLHGLTTGLPLERCAALGGMCAAEVISHVGARPLRDLAALAADAFPAG